MENNLKNKYIHNMISVNILINATKIFSNHIILVISLLFFR